MLKPNDYFRWAHIEDHALRFGEHTHIYKENNRSYCGKTVFGNTAIKTDGQEAPICEQCFNRRKLGIVK